MGARSVFAALATQDFLLVDVDQHGLVPAPAGLRLKVASLAPHDGRMDLKGVATALIRPDGYVAWVGERPMREYFPRAELARWMRVP
jgi:hypothetical protein